MNAKLQQLEDELKKERWAKWLSYRRRSVDMTDDEQKIEVAQRVIAMPSFGWLQSWYEHLWAARHGTNKAT